MVVVSLFDGMGTGYLALKKAGIKVTSYFASEIDEFAIKVAMFNHPDIIQVGDVRNLTKSCFPKKVDLVLSGSPCQDVSFANRLSDGTGIFGQKSSLIWESFRLVDELKPSHFLFENVPMKKEFRNIITNKLGVQPFEMNSNLVSAQNRKRLWWSSDSSNISFPNDLGILIKDIIYDNSFRPYTDKRIANTKIITSNYVKWDLSGKGYYSQQDRAYFLDKKLGTLSTNCSSAIKLVVDIELDLYRRLHPIEAERFQCVTDNYTDVTGVSMEQRFKMLGNGWNADVAAHILKSLI
jgi:site-specific DNA-cytosine methylase